MKNIIVSRLLPDKMRNILFAHGYNCINAGINRAIENETAYHPDMQFFKLNSNSMLCANELDETDEISNIQRKIITTQLSVGGVYPLDCLLNCFYANGKLICGRNVAQEIVDECKEKGRMIVHVKQGYAACSTIKLSESAFITSDITVYKALIGIDCDVIKVSNQEIGLNGFNNGFIGGCAFVDADSEYVFFTGDINKHVDNAEITAFIKKHNKRPISLSDDLLYDYGGAIIL